MRPVRPLSLLLLGAVVFLSACATNKDAFLNRTFHRLVARDNAWFNAHEKLKEAVAEMEKNYPADFDEVLPIFIDGTEGQAKAMTPTLEICIEKCATVVDRHSMEFGGKEKNTWIDDAYMVVGRSNYYKRSYFQAERTFDHTARRYKDSNNQQLAKLWQARSQIRLDQLARAQSSLDELRNMKVTPKRFRHDLLSATQADLDLRRGKVDDAIVNLERAVQVAQEKKDRVRWSFILAQLYQMKGQQEKAIAQYDRVVRMNPPYEVGFHARIFRSTAFAQGNTEAVRKQLRRMLRDEKHEDHFDMIHYALAELDLKENKDSSAVVELKASARKSTKDTRQKTKTFLKLADLFFDDKQYHDAQLYYDSTATLIAETHPRAEEVRTRAEVLTELVQHLGVIAREDSLQAFAQLDPEEQERRIRRLIREKERDEEDREAAERLARETVVQQPAKPTGGGGGGTAGWYFYNNNQLGRGANEFRKKWGTRPNEDDWRRKDKSGSATFQFTEQEDDPEEDGSTAEANTDLPPWKDPANYLKDLPTDPEAVAASDARICDALYLSGMIYKEKLKDVDNAIESFEVLNNRFDDCRYTPESHYQLYRIYLEKERTGSFFGEDGSGIYARVIENRWPDSEFARLVRNPDQLQADELERQAETAAYEELYQKFRAGHYIPVITGCEQVITTQPENHLLPKYYLLKAMAVGGMRETTAFRNALSAVISGFPGTEEAKAATAILATLDGNTAQNGQPPPQKAATVFSMEQGQHYFVVVVPNAEADVQTVKAKISDFNKAHFRNTPIQVNTMMLDKDTQLVMMSMFDTKEKSMEYYAAFKGNTDQLADINAKNLVSFAIGQGNYQRFYASKDLGAYTAFFTENYLKAK